MEEVLLWSLLVVCLNAKRKREVRKRLNIMRRSRWSRSWLIKRHLYSHVRLLKELRGEPEDWRNYLRMNTETYNYLLELVSPHIEKQNTCMRKALSPHEKLTATLRFLATGRSYKDLEFTTCISKQALSVLIPETCIVIYQVLRKEYLKVSKQLFK